ncbi:MAG TPA: hypothetical protein VG326_13695 [Tepidisphaeraceae bacterium]|jgi:hypothetical protein|nr:hypothetical protein [Tepidisphaeraceae bacterium]
MTATFRRFGCWTICAAVMLLGGCSSFDRDWNAAAGVAPANPVDITGRWQGTWASSVGTHHGDLRCLITRTDAVTYHARYAATYGGIFHFEYEIPLVGEREGEWIHFEGDADLGALAGGVYHHEGHANSTDLFATYRSSDDNGRYTMKRPRE